MRGMAGVLALCWPAMAHATDVAVHVANVGSDAGTVRALVCTRETWLTPNCNIEAKVPAHVGPVLVVVRGVPPGTYGVIAHHDADDDGDVNQNFIGIPTEGIGFSRGVRIRFSAPSFDAAATAISGPRVDLNIDLQFETSAPSGRRER